MLVFLGGIVLSYLVLASVTLAVGLLFTETNLLLWKPRPGGTRGRRAAGQGGCTLTDSSAPSVSKTPAGLPSPLRRARSRRACSCCNCARRGVDLWSRSRTRGLTACNCGPRRPGAAHVAPRRPARPMPPTASLQGTSPHRSRVDAGLALLLTSRMARGGGASPSRSPSRFRSSSRRRACTAACTTRSTCSPALRRRRRARAVVFVVTRHRCGRAERGMEEAAGPPA